MLDSLIAEEIIATEYGATVRCGPLIYRVECAHRDAERLAGETLPVTVPVVVELTDETMILVGFSSVDRRKLYQALRGVTGIGRRSALLVLDCGEVIDTLRAVSGKDQTYFQEVPGVGKARVGAIVLELAKRYKETLPFALPLAVPIWVEARDALMQSGLTPQAAERLLRTAIDAADAPPRSAEALLALAGH